MSTFERDMDMGTDDTSVPRDSCVLIVGAVAGLIGGVLMALWGMIAGAERSMGSTAVVEHNTSAARQIAHPRIRSRHPAGMRAWAARSL